MTKKRTVAVVALVVLTAAAIFAFSACSSGEGAWAEMGVDKDSIAGITLVSGSGTLKRLEGDRLTAFIADFDALTLRKSSEGFPDNGYDYAVRVTSEGEDGYLEYRLGQQLILHDGFGGADAAFYYLDDGYAAAAETVRAYFYAM